MTEPITAADVWDLLGVSVLGGLTSPYTYVIVVLGAVMAYASEVLADDDRRGRHRPGRTAVPDQPATDQPAQPDQPADQPAPAARREDPIACTPAADPATNTQAARTLRRAGYRGALGGPGAAYTSAGDRRPASWTRSAYPSAGVSLSDIAPQFGKNAQRRRSST